LRRELLWAEPVHIVTIVGLMGTGKTTIALNIADAYQPDIIIVAWTETLEEAIDELRSEHRERCALIVDDITYTVKRNDPRLALIARIRHQTRCHRYLIINVLHYVRGAPPFMRISHSSIATSCVNKTEAQVLEEFFSYAWDYCYLWRPDKRLALVRWFKEEWVEVIDTSWRDRALEVAERALWLGPRPPL